ncbi:MAG: hypothetical protein M1834_007178 [Cirrosporium novae-zelandiae]|nr:MAG: hypothetical protein M1834_007178 [Cirrosporium novae-zelandiae]
MDNTILSKPSAGTTAREMNKKYTLDGIDDDIVFGAGNGGDDGFTKNDQKDMDRMGKQQELKRNYRSLSALSFTAILQGTWEFLLISNTQGMIDGGLAGLFWTYVWTFFGFGIVMLSLAEMASMAPISGGQYHWVSEFAPPKYQKFLSYMTGWMSTLSWQAGSASGPYLTGTIIQGLISVNDPSYNPTDWQGTLFIFSMVIIIYIANIWLSDSLPVIQNVLMMVHIFDFCAVIIVLWVMSPTVTAKAVFVTFYNGGGWSSMAVALMIGQISAIYGSLCSDATAHMAEEVKDAGRNVPLAMVWSYVVNGIMGIILLITYLFCIQNVEDAIDDPSGFPFIYVFRNAVSTGGVNVLTAILLVLVTASNISFNASTSRQTFAFGRDRGLPFSKWVGKVHPKRQIPVNAITLSCGITILLSLINIGSSAAFNAIISLQVVALMFTYAISISCVLYRRLKHPELLPQARWSLGRWGIPVNAFGLCYVTFALFWSVWPNETPVDAETFNWSVVIFAVVGIVSLVMYFVQGRSVYEGPVMDISGREEEDL